MYGPHQALFASTIDYAGMFPPAKLSFYDTLKVAAEYRRRGATPWLMNRIVLPMKELGLIDDSILFDRGADGAAWNFTALATAGDPWGVLESDLEFLSRFNRDGWHAPIRRRAVSYEWKAPVGTDIVEGWRRTLSRVDWSFLSPFTVFVEVPPEGDGFKSVEQLASLQIQDRLTFGLKIRTGGEKTPSANDLTRAIEVVKRSDLKFKATQGLHEAVTHDRAFGFINLFVALNFHLAVGLSTEEIKDCLGTKNGGDFLFSKNAVSWKGFSLETDRIWMARKRHGGAFGSCSLDEPAESLKKFMGVQS